MVGSKTGTHHAVANHGSVTGAESQQRELCVCDFSKQKLVTETDEFHLS